MKKFIILLLILTSYTSNAQTVLFYHNFGKMNGDIENYTSDVNSKQTEKIHVSRDNPKLSSNNPSWNYMNASGGSNLLFSNVSDGHIQIDGINTFNYTNLTLTMAIFKSNKDSNGSELLIEVGVGGVFSSLNYQLPIGVGTDKNYHLISIENIPSNSNLSIRLRYVYNGSKTNFRVDDIKLSGCLVPSQPTLKSQEPSCLFKLVDVPSNTFIQNNANGVEFNPINIVLETGTYYARTVSTVFGCGDVWSKATPVYIKVDTIPTILKHPKNSITIFDSNYEYTFIAKANTPYVWEVSKDNGLSWNDLEIKEPFRFNEDTLFIKFNNVDYKLYNGYQFRIMAYNGGCKTYSTHGTIIVGTELPIKLISLYGDRFFNVNAIGFTTTEEKDTDRYEIERSFDNNRWEKIGLLEAAENSNANITYTFYDNFPANGLNYYRLKMYTTDKNFVYSPTIIVQTNDIVKNKRYYDLSGLEAQILKPNTYYIESIDGVAKRVVMAK